MIEGQQGRGTAPEVALNDYRRESALWKEGAQEKSPGGIPGLSVLIGQRPTLPHTRARSTIGAEGLNYRVRDGNGWDPLAVVTQNS